jgi:toluene monooxygenase system protein A
MGHLDSPKPFLLVHNGRKYSFCSEPCKWIFQSQPARFQGHLNLIDRFLAGMIQPPDLMGGLAYMGISPEEMGQDATNFAWAFPKPPVVKAS